MARATSASLYGSGTPRDLSRLTWQAPPRAYGLRSGSSTTGYYPAYGVRPRRKARIKVDEQGYVQPVAMVDDDAPVVRYTGPDYGNERRIAASINPVTQYN